MKIIFLDVDGVLNSYRGVAADGGFPFPECINDPKHNESNLDRIAIGMIRKLCIEYDAKIVLHSTWRLHTDPVEFGKRLKLPIISGTDESPKHVSIQNYLRAHPEIVNYIVIDDDDMDVGNRQIRTDLEEGFTFADYMKAQKKLAMKEGMGMKP